MDIKDQPYQDARSKLLYDQPYEVKQTRKEKGKSCSLRKSATKFIKPSKTLEVLER